MKNDRSQKDILAVYEKIGNTLTVVSFKDGTRTMSYSGLSLYKALAEKLRLEAYGLEGFIIWTGHIVYNDHDNREMVEMAANDFDKDFSELCKKHGGL
jgi:hypothetical protein